MSEIKAVEIECELIKVQSMREGQFRVTLDISQSQAEQASWLMIEASKTNVTHRAVIAVNMDKNDGEQQPNTRKLHI